MTGNKDEPHKEQRTLAISNFRNLGVSTDDNNNCTFLKLNRSLEFNELGGLVLVMGLNNSGKSNVLHALEKQYTKTFDANDKPDFLTMENIQPRISMTVGNNHTDSIGKELAVVVTEYLRTQTTFDSYHNMKENPLAINDFNRYLNIVDRFLQMMNNGSIQPDWEPIWKTMATIIDKGEILKEFGSLGSEFIKKLGSKDTSLDALCKLWHIKQGGDEYNVFSKYGYFLNNRVIRYDRNVKQIKENDLKCQPNNINEFFKTLMCVIEVKYEELTGVYTRATEKNGVRKTFEKKCNAKLKSLAKDFNNMFTADPENEYRFELTLDTSFIYFTIYRGTIPLGSLDRQSDGFRWMFDFYFNFIKRINFSAGDIILMDEFGYNLNPKSIKELAVIIRNYAKTFGLTFVIATQNFLIVDTHHLDEIRLVINDANGNSRIINEFEQFDHENHDILRPLIDALTVGRNFMREEGHRTIFVEGSSDYFFLTTFADEMRKNNKHIDIDFLPINGLGKRDSDMKVTISSLLSIESHPIVLTDSDGAGKKFEEIAKDINEKLKKNVITVLNLSECSGDKNIVEIEKMFTDDEIKHLGFDRKSFDINASFAQNPKHMELISDETRKKFETLIDNISLG